MKVTLAARHHQPRRSERRACDHHTGIALEADENASSVYCDGVQTYNILLPGQGNHRFDLCEPAAEELRSS